MPKRLINIVDSVQPINIGIWNSVLINSDLLKRNGVNSELWFPTSVFSADSVVTRQIHNSSIDTLKIMVKTAQLDPRHDVIVTHGLWHYPTKWGSYLKGLGYKWIYVPHGMLEPWPLKQKWLKKKIYFKLIENRHARRADLIRAVSRPEAANLKYIFPKSKVEYIPNGVAIDQSAATNFQESDIVRYLFLSRLHHKKNVFALAEAWKSSTLNNHPGFELNIAGPDQGELKKLSPILQQSGNIHYIGVVRGEAKNSLFAKSTFYVLPSFSEGMPSALLEAMSYGLIPIVSEGCNFPDIIERSLGVKVSTERVSIQAALEKTSAWDWPSIKRLKSECQQLIFQQYSLKTVTEQQMSIYFDKQTAYIK